MTTCIYDRLRTYGLDIYYPEFKSRGLYHVVDISFLAMQDYAVLGVLNMDDRQRLFRLVQKTKDERRSGKFNQKCSCHISRLPSGGRNFKSRKDETEARSLRLSQEYQLSSGRGFSSNSNNSNRSPLRIRSSRLNTRNEQEIVVENHIGQYRTVHHSSRNKSREYQETWNDVLSQSYQSNSLKTFENSKTKQNLKATNLTADEEVSSYFSDDIKTDDSDNPKKISSVSPNLKNCKVPVPNLSPISKLMENENEPMNDDSTVSVSLPLSPDLVISGNKDLNMNFEENKSAFHPLVKTFEQISYKDHKNKPLFSNNSATQLSGNLTDDSLKILEAQSNPESNMNNLTNLLEIKPSSVIKYSVAGYNYGVPTTEVVMKKSNTTNLKFDDRIRVCARKRPLRPKELRKKEVNIVNASDEETLIVKEPKLTLDLQNYVQQHEFQFDEVFNENCSNEHVYERTTKPLVNWIFKRANATCFAFGQTGSGKTHTILGGPNTPGLYLLAARDIFALMNSGIHGNRLQLVISYYEIYCSHLYDLLNDRKRVNAREDSSHKVHISGLSAKQVTSVSEVMGIVEHGNAVRKKGSTGGNRDSSRSHAVLQMEVRNNRKERIGRLSLIDLAGSERAADITDTNRQTRHEGAEINQSLLALKECIRAIDQDSKHTPFRQSKLTHILKGSFVGNSKTCMIANISPTAMNCEHTLNTLKYAYRVRQLKQNCKSRPEDTNNTSEHVSPTAVKIPSVHDIHEHSNPRPESESDATRPKRKTSKDTHVQDDIVPSRHRLAGETNASLTDYQTPSIFHPSVISCSSTPKAKLLNAPHHNSSQLDLDRALQTASDTPVRGHKLAAKEKSAKLVSKALFRSAKVIDSPRDPSTHRLSTKLTNENPSAMQESNKVDTVDRSFQERDQRIRKLPEKIQQEALIVSPGAILPENTHTTAGDPENREAVVDIGNNFGEEEFEIIVETKNKSSIVVKDSNMLLNTKLRDCKTDTQHVFAEQSKKQPSLEDLMQQMDTSKVLKVKAEDIHLCTDETDGIVHEHIANLFGKMGKTVEATEHKNVKNADQEISSSKEPGIVMSEISNNSSLVKSEIQEKLSRQHLDSAKHTAIASCSSRQHQNMTEQIPVRDASGKSPNVRDLLKYIDKVSLADEGRIQLTDDAQHDNNMQNIQMKNEDESVSELLSIIEKGHNITTMTSQIEECSSTPRQGKNEKVPNFASYLHFQVGDASSCRYSPVRKEYAHSSSNGTFPPIKANTALDQTRKLDRTAIVQKVKLDSYSIAANNQNVNMKLKTGYPEGDNTNILQTFDQISKHAGDDSDSETLTSSQENSLASFLRSVEKDFQQNRNTRPNASMTEVVSSMSSEQIVDNKQELAILNPDEINKRKLSSGEESSLLNFLKRVETNLDSGESAPGQNLVFDENHHDDHETYSQGVFKKVEQKFKIYTADEINSVQLTLTEESDLARFLQRVECTLDTESDAKPKIKCTDISSCYTDNIGKNTNTDSEIVKGIYQEQHNVSLVSIEHGSPQNKMIVSNTSLKKTYENLQTEDVAASKDRKTVQRTESSSSDNLLLDCVEEFDSNFACPTISLQESHDFARAYQFAGFNFPNRAIDSLSSEHRQSAQYQEIQEHRYSSQSKEFSDKQFHHVPACCQYMLHQTESKYSRRHSCPVVPSFGDPPQKSPASHKTLSAAGDNGIGNCVFSSDAPVSAGHNLSDPSDVISAHEKHLSTITSLCKQEMKILLAVQNGEMSFAEYQEALHYILTLKTNCMDNVQRFFHK